MHTGLGFTLGPGELVWPCGDAKARNGGQNYGHRFDSASGSLFSLKVVVYGILLWIKHIKGSN